MYTWLWMTLADNDMYGVCSMLAAEFLTSAMNNKAFLGFVIHIGMFRHYSLNFGQITANKNNNWGGGGIHKQRRQFFGHF